MKPIEIAQQCLEWDPNEETRKAILDMLNTNSLDSIQKVFSTRVEFGTTGLRAPMGPGTSCLNDLIILQTAQGLAKYLLETNKEDSKECLNLFMNQSTP